VSDDDRSPPPPGSRTAARRRALDVLYAADLLDQPIAKILADALHEPDDSRPTPYAVELASGVERYRSELDTRIEAAAERWTLDRMPLVDRNVLRLATYELLAEPTLATAVILNEAVELAKLLSTADSGRFVNGVLSRIARETRPEPAR